MTGIFGAEGGGGEGAGAIAQAAAAIVSMVIGVVQYEDQPATVFNRAVVKFPNAVAGLRRVKREYAEASGEHQELRRWWNDSAHWQTWKKNGKSHDPLRTCNDSAVPPKKLCSFRDPLLAKKYQKDIKAFEDPTNGILACIRAGAGTCGGEHPSDWTPRAVVTEDVFSPNIENAGSIEAYRRYARRYHQHLTGLDVYRDFFLLGGMPLPSAPVEVSDPAVLKLLYPEEHFAQDIARGILPYTLRNTLLGGAINLYRNEIVPGSFTLQPYVYHLTPAEQRQVGIAVPTIQQTADFVAGMTTGTGPGIPDISMSLGQWIKAGMPSNWQGRVTSRPVPSVEDALADVLVPETPPTIDIKVALAAGVAAFLTVLGIGLVIFSRRR